MSIYSELEKAPVGSIALEPALSVSAATSVRDVVATMHSALVDHVLVLDGDRLVGIFTERDLLMRAIRPDGVPDAPVREFMTPDPTVLSSTLPLSSALEPMVKGRYRHLPIADGDGGFIGVLTTHNLFHFLAVCK